VFYVDVIDSAECAVGKKPPALPLGMRDIHLSENYRGIKVTVLYTVGLLNTAVYRTAVLIFNKLSSWHNLFHFVHCVL